MNFSELRARIKPWMLPIAMVIGALTHSYIDSVQFLAPWLIFAMLLITFCRIRPQEFHLTPIVWIVVGVQILGGIAIYYCIEPFGVDLAQGSMICVICPTATAAPVITSMLGGSITTVVTISLLSNFALALIGPAFFAFISADAGLSIGFFDAFSAIVSKVGPLLLGPMVIAFAMQRFTPKAHASLAKHQALSFYIWSVSLILVVGKAVSFAMAEPADKIPDMIALGLLAGVMCGAQFLIGRRIGRRFGDAVAGAQSLAQKNTVLAVWMAANYLNPISSIAPAAYVAWQNTVNSLQIYFKTKR